MGKQLGAAAMRSASQWPTSQWDESLLQHLRDLYEPLRRFAGVVGRFDVEPDDLVQEAYTRFLSAERSDVTDLGAYLRRSIVNLASNERRRLRRASNVQHRIDLTDGVADHYPSGLSDLMQLDARDRALLYLVDVEGHSVGEAAATVNLAAPAARMALSRARKALRTTIASELRND